MTSAAQAKPENKVTTDGHDVSLREYPGAQALRDRVPAFSRNGTSTGTTKYSVSVCTARDGV